MNVTGREEQGKTRPPAPEPLLVLVSRGERALAAGCYLLPLMGMAAAVALSRGWVAWVIWFVVLLGPLVVWRQAKDRSAALRTHAARAFSVQVTVYAAGLVSAVLMLLVLGLFGVIVGPQTSGLAWGLAVVVAPVALVQMFYLALAVAGALGAWRNRFVRLPLVLPVLR